MATDIIEAARGWIGTPYRHQASVKGAGCDCLGLLRGVWRELHGDEPESPPPYAPDWSEGGAETLRDAFARHLTPVAAADIAPGDAVLFRMVIHSGRASARGGGPAKHCGIIADRDGALTLIHARQNRRVVEEGFSAFWRARLAYAFRV
jgi:NlpC/P60 family putative phage cell wall peptidase